RRYPDSLHARQAMIRAMGLGERGPQAEIPVVEAIGVGTAVLLKDAFGNGTAWYLIEEGREIRPGLYEIAPDNPVAKAVLGKRAGDSVEISEPFGTVRRCVVEQTMHKWVFRFQRCIEELPTRFPEQQLFKALK